MHLDTLAVSACRNAVGYRIRKKRSLESLSLFRIMSKRKGKMKTMTLVISLQGMGLNEIQALKVRNAIEALIESNDSVEVVGAGVNLDGSEIDLEIETSDVEGASSFIEELMASADLEGRYKLETK